LRAIKFTINAVQIFLWVLNYNKIWIGYGTFYWAMGSNIEAGIRDLAQDPNKFYWPLEILPGPSEFKIKPSYNTYIYFKKGNFGLNKKLISL